MVGELLPEDPRQIGPYRLTGVLGGGGMGRVYLGWSPGGRPVAVKVVRAELAADAEFRARFRREVAAARTINGLYTAILVDADLDSPVPWLATTYIDGPSLAEAVASQGQLAAGPLRALAAGLAEALAAIHAAGLIHRDLKPSNILMASDGPKVIDFGISRAAETTALTHTGQYMGSPGFLSPEQAEGREVGPATDIFSLGAVLAFAATGSGPFGTGALPALLYRVVHVQPGLGGVPAGIRPLVERCLAKAPADRPTASDLLAELTGARPQPLRPPEQVIAPPAEPPPPVLPQPGRDGAYPPAGFTATITTPQVPRPADGQTRRDGLRRLSRQFRWPAAAVAAIAIAAAIALAVTAGGPRSSGPPTATGHSSPAARAVAAGVPSTTQPSATTLPSASLPATSLPVTSLPSATPGSPASVQPGPTLTTRSAPAQRPTASHTPAAPPLPLTFTAQGVTQDACSAEGSVQSPASTSKVLYTFTNNSQYTIQLFWLTFTGSRQLYATMPPGDQTQWDTYVGHYWLIASTAGQCQAIVQIDSAGQLTVA